jgi:hypothetical protein
MSTRKPSQPPPPSGTVAQWASQTLRSWSVGALPIINYFLERLQLEAILQAHLPSRDGRGKLPVARGLIILVQNILLAREPLYGLRAWAALHDPQLLGLTPEQIGSLNDDRIGRCLTALFHLLSALVPCISREFALLLRSHRGVEGCAVLRHR